MTQTLAQAIAELDSPRKHHEHCCNTGKKIIRSQHRDVERLREELQRAEHYIRDRSGNGETDYRRGINAVLLATSPDREME